MFQIKKALINYFGYLQIPHLLLNFLVIFVVDKATLIAKQSASLTPQTLNAFLLTAYIDFFFTSPMALLFLYGFNKNKKWATTVGLVALTSAFLSGLVYIYELAVFNAFELNITNIAIMIIFAPPIVLFFLALFNVFKNLEYLSDKKN